VEKTPSGGGVRRPPSPPHAQPALLIFELKKVLKGKNPKKKPGASRHDNGICTKYTSLEWLDAFLLQKNPAK